MKKSGILNRHLAGALAMLGHTDRVVVCDAGLPIPVAPGLMVVDLAFRAGVPSFEEVLSGLMDELEIEGAMAAEEIKKRNEEAAALLDGLFPSLQLVPHEEFKARARHARLVVRTGEVKPHANVILHCGVPF
jgi:D-ribose pyranase